MTDCHSSLYDFIREYTARLGGRRPDCPGAGAVDEDLSAGRVGVAAMRDRHHQTARTAAAGKRPAGGQLARPA